MEKLFMSRLKMPAPDQATLDRRSAIVAALRRMVPGEGVIDTPARLRAYETDGLTAYRQVPMVAVLPDTVDQVLRILGYCHDNNIRVVPRGGGTGLSGGALPLADAVLLGMSKFNRILDIDHENRCVTVEMSPRAWRPPSKSVCRRIVFQLVSGSTWERPSVPPAS